MEIQGIQVADTPVPVLLAECAAGYSSRSEFLNNLEIGLWKTLPATRSAAIRAVTFDRLATIAAFGCDVVPTDAPLYATSSLSKAVEYGADGDQVIQFFSV